MIRDPRTFSGQSNGRKALTIPVPFIVLFVVLAAAIAMRGQVARPSAVPAVAAGPPSMTSGAETPGPIWVSAFPSSRTCSSRAGRTR